MILDLKALAWFKNHVKKLAGILLATALVASCAKKDIEVPPRIPVVPSVAKLPAITPPSVDRVQDTAASQRSTIRRVEQDNRELTKKIGSAEKQSSELRRLLAARIAEEQANKAQLEEIARVAEKEREALKEMGVTIASQKATIDLLNGTSKELESQIRDLAAKVAVSNRRAADLDSQLDTANTTIASLAGAHDEAVVQAGKLKAQNAVERERTKTANRWKWRFFWWAIGSTAVVLVILGLYAISVYRKFATPFL